MCQETGNTDAVKQASCCLILATCLIYASLYRMAKQ
uniref:Uncharacterized protein n=1 Tax=Arundo donax TaxID=35708 RepID=A0A0A9I181_ARUDO